MTIRDVLDDHKSLCLEDEDDRNTLNNALVEEATGIALTLLTGDPARDDALVDMVWKLTSMPKEQASRVFKVIDGLTGKDEEKPS